METTPILNAFSIDVEDYFHVSAFSSVINPQEWELQESRVVANTEKILDLLEEAGIKGTFFVLGWVAKRNPSLVKKIHDLGHEIASHGMTHQLVYNQTPEKFRQETVESKMLLEDITGAQVKGYRAASYSITRKSLWAVDILVELGFVYDSSIFPIRHDRYGIPDAPELPHLMKTGNGNSIIEYPLSTRKIGSYKLPVSGGGYFRLYPYFLTRKLLKGLNKNGRSFIFYLHPWEVDPDQPRINASSLSRFRHYNNLGKCEERLSHLVKDFSFDRVDRVLENHGFKL